jgi:hypothetical protein
MQSKSLIFVVVGSLLVAAAYSSVNFVIAEPVTTCTGTSKTTARCWTYENNELQLKMDCTYHSKTKSWSCVESQSKQAGSEVPLGLQSAIDAARKESQKNAEDSKGLGDLKNDTGTSANPGLG